MIEISNYIQAFPRDFLFMTSYVWPPARLKGSGVARNQSKCCAVFRLHYRWLWWAQKPISSHKLGQLGREKSAVLPPEIEELKPQNGHETKVNWLIPKSLFLVSSSFAVSAVEFQGYTRPKSWLARGAYVHGGFLVDVSLEAVDRFWAVESTQSSTKWLKQSSLMYLPSRSLVN